VLVGLLDGMDRRGQKRLDRANDDLNAREDKSLMTPGARKALKIEGVVWLALGAIVVVALIVAAFS